MITMETEIASEPAVCYQFPSFIPPRMECYVFVSEDMVVNMLSDFLEIPDVKTMWDSIQFLD
jgi:hypothetical protein